MKRLFLLSLSVLLMATPLHAEKNAPVDPAALALLKNMSTTLTGAKSFTVRSTSIFEIPAITGQLITLFSTGNIALERPNKLRAQLAGDAPAFDFFYNGSSVSAIAPQTKVYSSTSAPSTLDEMLSGLTRETGIRFPSAPLFYHDPYSILTRDLESGVVIGRTKVDGVACDHLAFRSPGVNWEIWIESGAKALPSRLAVTFTDKPLNPRTVVEFSHWNLHPWLSKSFFDFQKPSGFSEIPFSAVLHSTGR